MIPATDLSSAVASRIDGLTSWVARYWAPLILGLIMLGDSWDAIVIAYVCPPFGRNGAWAWWPSAR